VTGRDDRVLAIVLTYNAPRSIVRCVRAIIDQTRPPDHILVVDNDSDPPAAEALESAGLAGKVEIARQGSNGGPAGGWAAGLGEFAARDYELAWLMDDDAVPEPSCLAALLREATRRGAPSYLFPQWVEPDGTVTRWPAWCGLLISRSIVERVGVPIAELFWWAEDTEYLWWRIPAAGHPVVHVADAVVHHTYARRHTTPTWKYYYEARNSVYIHLRYRRNLKRIPYKMLLLLGRIVRNDHDHVGERLVMMARGISDGVRGRLGKRVPVERWGEGASRS
jgi:GT2 family glycosyltransferase